MYDSINMRKIGNLVKIFINTVIIYLYMDSFDLRILKEISRDSRKPLKEIGKAIGIYSASAISRRIKEMQENNIIKGFKAEIDFGKLGYNFVTATFVRAKYGIEYHDIVAEKIMKIKGVIDVLFLLGDIDFYILCATKTKDDYVIILNELEKITEIERSDTHTVLNIYKYHDIANIF